MCTVMHEMFILTGTYTIELKQVTTVTREPIVKVNIKF